MNKDHQEGGNFMITKHNLKCKFNTTLHFEDSTDVHVIVLTNEKTHEIYLWTTVNDYGYKFKVGHTYDIKAMSCEDNRLVNVVILKEYHGDKTKSEQPDALDVLLGKETYDTTLTKD